MPVITMKVPCVVSAVASNDVYGQSSPGAPRKTLCAIVKLLTKSQHSTVRADSGATRGHADEVVADAVLLMSKREILKIGMSVLVRGVSLEIVSIRDRLDVMGRLDHYEIGCAIG